MVLTFRPWEPRDHDLLLPMIVDLLRINHECGAKWEPTTKNATVLLELGQAWASDGEPTLIAVDRALVLAGFILWGGLPNPLGLDLSGRSCTGIGTYVVASYRRHGVSAQLRNCAMQMARDRGYTSVDGAAYYDAGIRSATAVGFRATGAILEATL